MDGFGAPQFYAARYRPPMLGPGCWEVVMNNAVVKARFPSLDEAQRDAARRNYGEGCYQPPTQIGL